jgi:hypothetical protein
MNKLTHQHEASNYYHSVTMMCYRKNKGCFEFFKEWVFLRGEVWQESGMKKGFNKLRQEANNVMQ